MAAVSGDDDRAQGRSDRADEEVGVRETSSLMLEQRLGLAEDLDGDLVKAEDGQGTEKARQQRAIVPRRSGLGGAIEELGGGDPGRRDVVRSRGSTFYHRLVAPQDCDARVGIEEPQRSTSRPDERRLVICAASVARSTSDSQLPASLRHAAS